MQVSVLLHGVTCTVSISSTKFTVNNNCCLGYSLTSLTTETQAAADQFKCSIDVVGHLATRWRRQAALVSCAGALWVQVLIGGDHLFRPIRWDAHVTHKVQRVVRMTRQPHQLVSLEHTLSALEKLLSMDDLSRADRVIMPLHMLESAAAAGTMLHISPRQLAADNVTTETYYYGRQCNYLQVPL